MAFVLPKEYAEAPPTPLASSGVVVETTPARLVAVKAFAGLVTQEEVERQRAALLEALAADGSYAPAEEAQVSVLQYNSPLTVLWRRRNEVAVVVTACTPPGADTAAPGDGAADAVTSWYDSGIRLEAGSE